MKAVDILGRIDGQQHVRGVDVLGQRQLHQDAVHALSALSLAISASSSASDVCPDRR